MKRFCVILFLFPLLASAQSLTLTGYVKDSLGQPLRSASVQLLDRNLSTVSDAEGMFTIRLTPGNVTVVITYTGYKKVSETLSLKKDSVFIFVLEPKVEELKEVEVSGRFHQSDQLKTTRG